MQRSHTPVRQAVGAVGGTGLRALQARSICIVLVRAAIAVRDMRLLRPMHMTRVVSVSMAVVTVVGGRPAVLRSARSLGASVLSVRVFRVRVSVALARCERQFHVFGPAPVLMGGQMPMQPEVQERRELIAEAPQQHGERGQGSAQAWAAPGHSPA